MTTTRLLPQHIPSETSQILAVSSKEGGHHNSRILGTYTNYLAHNVMTKALSGKVLLTNG